VNTDFPLAGGTNNFASTVIPVYAHCSLQYDEDHIVLLGGNTWSQQNGQYDIPDVQIYNMETGEWKKGRDMPMARQRAGCIKAEINGRSGILVAGGFCHGNPDFDECDLLRLDSTMFYDWQNDSWEDLAAPLHENRDGLNIENIGGRILAYGGEFRGGPVTVIEEWDGSKWVNTDFPLAGGTNNFASTVIPVYAHCSLQYDEDHIVLLGGNTWSQQNGQYDIPDVQIYNMETGEWKKGRDMPMARQRAGCIKAEINGRSGILVAGGFCHGNPDFDECDLLRLDSTMFYDWQNDSWEDLAAPLHENRDGLNIENIGGRILAYGGEFRGGPVTVIEEWDGSKWVNTDFPLAGGTNNFASTVIPEDSYKC
jgi:hypothetical protein